MGTQVLEKPVAVFDRDREWDDLAELLDPGAGLRIGTVYGRRRQGKSFLLRALVEASGGLYHLAIEEERTPALERFGRTVADRLELPAALRFSSWEQALRTALQPSVAGPLPLLVLDELPYLLRGAPELPSVLQLLYDEARATGEPAGRVVLCGSAMSIMSELLSGTRALRGRAVLDLPLGPFDHRQARQHWQIADLDVAFHLHAVLGGTPGYRDLVRHDPPRRVSGFGAWLGRSLLNPSHALFREADYLLAEEPGITDRALYHSALAAISRGAASPSTVAAALGRDEGSVRHVLSMLIRARMVDRDEDALLRRRPVLRVADPVLRFDHLIVRPHLAALEQRRAERVWASASQTFSAQILGPTFERLAREWTVRYAAPATVGGIPTTVGSTVVNDAAGRTRAELDVVALDRSGEGRPRALALGEAKSSAGRRGVDVLRRLEHVRDLLRRSDRVDVEGSVLMVFARGGWDAALAREAALRDDVALVDLERLYEGD